MKKAPGNPLSLTHLLCLSATLGFSGSAMAALFTSGHGDFAVGLHDGEFEFGYHLGEGDDTATVDGVIVDDAEFEADELEVRVNQSIVVPVGTDQALLNGTGAAEGSTLYLISQDSDGVGSVILGLGTEELEQPAGVTWTDVSYTLNGSTGPGQFSLYFNNGGTFEFGISEAEATNAFTFPAGGHEERNWAFTETGTYVLDFTASATRTDGAGSVPYTANSSFTFVVVPEPSSTLLAVFSAIGFLARRRRS